MAEPEFGFTLLFCWSQRASCVLRQLRGSVGSCHTEQRRVWDCSGCFDGSSEGDTRGVCSVSGSQVDATEAVLSEINPLLSRSQEDTGESSALTETAYSNSDLKACGKLRTRRTTAECRQRGDEVDEAASSQLRGQLHRKQLLVDGYHRSRVQQLRREAEEPSGELRMEQRAVQQQHLRDAEKIWMDCNDKE
ncbi:hypothetical protein Esti_004431 [Eimeria stiedai]